PLALTQGWASERMNPELRQRAEEDRLLQEIQFLREEMRIKDARMEQIEPHRRPHYPPTARLAILELRAARAWVKQCVSGSCRIRPPRHGPHGTSNASISFLGFLG